MYIMVPLSVTSTVAILLTFNQSVIASSGLNLRRASSANVGARSLRGDVDLTQCYQDIVSVADEQNILTKDAYLLLADIMSNQWFSDNGIDSYTELPYDMKFAFVTLACECRNMGGAENCCQNHRASLNVDGADGQDVSQAQTDYLNDICSLTYSTIGSDRINPKPGEMPTTAQPTPPAPTQPPAPTPSPTKKVDPIITPPTPPPRPDYPSGGMGAGGIAGVSLAAAAVLTLIVFLIGGRKEEEQNEEEKLEDIEADDMLKVDANADVGDDAPDSDGSPDGTKSMTTVFSEQSTIATGVNVAAVAVANTNMLPGIEDSENETDDEENIDQPHEIPGDLSSLSSCSQGDFYANNESYESPALPPAKQDDDINDALDYAIENGNWEQVAASAAALVEKEM
ncbi:hypothetical protein QTG54_016557 [Skeletonema marinoi]|uniref:Uncharacterized protein n=1 Tax=Skeletonema marinoi TaxID=267567 RepID=A0AAD8XSG5_9STRA|nr:hypothetical protein QTG54_016557 [Skeletonema marinoi]